MLCPYCGQSNPPSVTRCRKCDASLVPSTQTVHSPRTSLVGPERARQLRQKALTVLVLGLLIKVYWGGYWPWPIIDTEPWARIRPWLDPWLIYGGAVLYLLGWILNWV